MATSTKQTLSTVPVYDYLMPTGDPTLTNPAGLLGKRVKVTLAFDKARSTSPITWLGSQTVYSTLTDQNGFWQVNVVPTDQITPSGTYYIVEVEGGPTYKINPLAAGVPAAGWASSAILLDIPAALNAVGQTVGPLTVTGTLTVSGAVTLSALAAGQIVFPGAGGLLSGDGGLFWDNTNKRLGIGTSAPAQPLDVIGPVNIRSGGLTVVAGGLIVSAGGAAVTGNSTVTGTLTVSAGLVASAGGLAATGNSTITGTLTVSAALTAQNGFTVSAGGAAITGATTVTGGLTVTAGITASGSTMTSNPGTADATGYSPFGWNIGPGSAVTNAIRAQTTIGVSTVAATILDLAGYRACLVTVLGTDGTNYFTDIVAWSIGGIVVVASPTATGAPTARTYTSVGNTAFQLAMASGTYRINAAGLALSAR